MTNIQSCISKIIVMCGLPCSGKSTISKELAEKYNAIIFSSDELRVEMFGDVNDQEHNQELFVELHKRIKDCLSNGKSAIYDACNINYKRRMAFLAELKNIPCEKVCVVIATPYEECLRRNAERDRKVPEHVITRMYHNFNIPYWYEGWNDIQIVGLPCSHYNVDEVVNALIDYHQGNSHHTFTLGCHLWGAYDYYCKHYLDEDHDTATSIATVLHDIGKPICRSEVNSRGANDGNAHYYNHQYTSAYDSLFVNSTFNRLDVAIRIMWHMQPYFWEKDNNEKLHSKYRKLWGEDLYQDIMNLHIADKLGH